MILTDEERMARKFYDCDASEHWRTYSVPPSTLSPCDRLILDGAQADKWKIRPGQRYRYVAFTEGRQLGVYRARLDMDSLCQRHCMYDD